MTNRESPSGITNTTRSPSNSLEIARLSKDWIVSKSGHLRHEIAIILGSGWAASGQHFGEVEELGTATEIPGFSPSTVRGHSGKVQSVALSGGKRVLIIGARTHLYEGKGVQAVVHPVRTAAACGAEALILTNGAGGIRKSWAPGQPVLISDHINLTATSPLEGANFVDLTDLYSKRLREIARTIDPTLDEGVYVQFRGPHYETPAEVGMAKAIGGDIVGMSTALEAIAAREAGMEVLGLSLITNLAAGISPHPLSHQEVIDAGKSAEPVISKLLADIVHAL